uniref:Uncharacterized protein n=1 Tax=candidate division WOR-3 bacterium TaxID=2052148 RepID=A0A7C4THK2_UNCW3
MNLIFTQLLSCIINFTLPGVVHQGDRIFYGNAHSLGLGGISIILEDGNNPASPGLHNNLFFSGTGLYYSGSEKRGLRVYDSYGNNIGISTISSNRLNKTNPNFASLYMPLKFLRFGMRYHADWDFNYLYRYEYRDDFYQIKKIVQDDYYGVVFSLAPVVAISTHFAKFGFEQDFLYGKIGREFKTVYPDGPDSIYKEENNFNGNRRKFGFILTPNIHLRLGYTFATKYSLKDKSDSLSYPLTHTIGFSYQPAGRVPTRFLIEVAREMWEEVIYLYKFGIEHTIVDRYRMRYGFCIFPDYSQPAVWTTNLTLGFGTYYKNYSFDFGLGFGKRDYASSDFGGLQISEKTIFDETMLHFLISFGVLF